MAKLTSGGMYVPNAQRSNEYVVSRSELGTLRALLKQMIEDERFNDRYIMSLPVLMTDGNWIQPIVIEAVECTSSYGWNKEITAQVQCGACGNVGNIPEDVRLKLSKIYKNAAIAVMAILNDLDQTRNENGQEG